MFGKIFGKKVNNAKAELKKVENRDLMQAIVGACVLIAGADGELETAELDTIEKAIRSNPSLAHFGPEITTTMGQFKDQLAAGFRLAKVKIMREIADIKNNQQDAEEVFVNAITIAESDGEIEPAELAVLAEIGRNLGLRLQDYGISA